MKKILANEVTWSLGDSGVRYLQQGPDMEWGVLKMKPGQSSYDYGKHIHHVVTETFYFMSGSPKFVINGEEYRVQPGDTYVIEPYDDHCVINDTDEDFEAVFIKHPYMPEDRHPVE